MASFVDLQSLLECKVTDRDGKQLDILTLRDINRIGLYFGASWCPPCHQFTPKLVRFYEEVNREEKQLEIIFLSSDLTQEEFAQYYAKMPWCALNFEEKEKKEELSRAFDVRGIPMFIVFDNAGKLVTREGRKKVNNYPDTFPWNA